ncbi:DUF4123 domain-containing protein, partial [Enterobacteriaceae bacterium YMB-R22]|uniref:DUF4123 domain-containing protein n=1 Tax=Tenebrionicola larvae TaxID=2815733 RepID=UPI002012E504
MNNFHCLTAPLALEQHTYVLIDRVSCKETLEAWPLIPAVSAILAPQEAFYPWLVPLASLTYTQTQALKRMLEKNAAAPDMMLLGSRYDVRTLAVRLADAFIFQPNEGRGRYLLRYYDSRVFYQLLRIQTARSLQHWSRQTGIDYCSWQDEAGMVTFDCRKLIVGSSEGGGVPVYPRLLNIGLINRAMLQYGVPANLEERWRLSGEIERLIDIAQEACGLRDPLDILGFAQLGLTVHPQCWRTQTVRSLLQQTTGVPGAFSDELALWDRQTRASLQQACERDFREEKVNA